MAKKANNSLTDLLQIVTLLDDPKHFNNIINALHKTIPVIPKKRRIPMSDTNINKIFRIRRINYSVIAKITDANDNLYTAEILSVDGESFNKVGDKLAISKRELQLTGRPTSSKL